uniref:Doublecortin domain-containing protein n=1 Tax=Electrophorus electricus TaxID=8005 RepID=A0A4W4DU42_ELEEL
MTPKLTSKCATSCDHTLMTSRQPYMTEPIASKHVCFFKSGDAQFNGLPVVINSRTFKTFEALLDSLSKRIPLPFGVRIITTPRGRTAIHSLDQLHHGQSYICSDKRTVKPIDLERARHKPLPWYHARPFSRRNLAWQSQSRHQAQRPAPRGTRGAKWRQHAPLLQAPRRLVVFRNGNPEVKHTLLLQKRTTHSFEALLDHISEVMCFPVLKLYTPDGRRLDGLSALIMCSGVVVASGREPFSKGDYDAQKPSAPTWLPSFRVNQDGSMTVEMKVHLTIKEEETI